MKCACGRELTTGDLNGMCLECFNGQNTEVNESSYTGWICPKCGSVWASQVEGCNYCNGPVMEQVLFTDDGETNHADKTKS